MGGRLAVAASRVCSRLMNGLVGDHTAPVAGRTRSGPVETDSGARVAEPPPVPDRVPVLNGPGPGQPASCPPAPPRVVVNRAGNVIVDRVDQPSDPSGATSRGARIVSHECALGFCDRGLRCTLRGGLTTGSVGRLRQRHAVARHQQGCAARRWLAFAVHPGDVLRRVGGCSRAGFRRADRPHTRRP